MRRKLKIKKNTGPSRIRTTFLLSEADVLPEAAAVVKLLILIFKLKHLQNDLNKFVDGEKSSIRVQHPCLSQG